jgi:hypothetical protein
MARLASVVKQGHFPAPPEAVAGILRHLRVPAYNSIGCPGGLDGLSPHVTH